MLRKVSAAVIALALAFPAIADVLSVKKDAPKQYVVKKGDTLWDISGIYLDKPWLWPRLWQMNPQVDNPHLIYPGDTLSLIYNEQGEPMLVLDKRHKKLSPYGRKTMKDGVAVPTLPLEAIKPFLTFEQALDGALIDQQPYVLGADENVKNQTIGHILYIKGNLERNRVYGIYHKGIPYVDPETQETLAYEVKLVGVARAFRSGTVSDGEPASVMVENVKREIKAGDFLMPITEGQALPAFFNISQPQESINGSIIASSNQLREFGSLDVVILNVGKEDNIKAGDMLEIARQSPTVIDAKDGPKYKEDANHLEKLMSSFSDGDEDASERLTWNMPKEPIGRLMVFKVQDNLSFALITKSNKPARVGDSVRNPQ